MKTNIYHVYVWRPPFWQWVSTCREIDRAKKRANEYLADLHFSDVGIFVLKPGQMLESVVHTTEEIQRVFDRVDQPKGNGISKIIGKWPGDETDEEINKILEELS